MFSNYLVCVQSLQKYSWVKGNVTQKAVSCLCLKWKSSTDPAATTAPLSYHSCRIWRLQYEKGRQGGWKIKEEMPIIPWWFRNPHLPEWPMQPISSYWKIRIPYDFTLAPTGLRAAFVLCSECFIALLSLRRSGKHEGSDNLRQQNCLLPDSTFCQAWAKLIQFARQKKVEFASESIQ